MYIQPHWQSYLVFKGKKYQPLTEERHDVWPQDFEVNCELTLKGQFSLHFYDLGENAKSYVLTPLSKNASMYLNGTWVRGVKIIGNSRSTLHPEGAISSIKGTWDIRPVKAEKCTDENCTMCFVEKYFVSPKQEREIITCKGQLPLIFPATAKYWNDEPRPLPGRKHWIAAP